MTYTKQEFLDWIEAELPDNAAVTFYATEVGEEGTIDDLLADLSEMPEEELLDYCLELDDESATHLVFLA